jgi:hypothetical protein
MFGLLDRDAMFVRRSRSEWGRSGRQLDTPGRYYQRLDLAVGSRHADRLSVDCDPDAARISNENNHFSGGIKCFAL